MFATEFSFSVTGVTHVEGSTYRVQGVAKMVPVYATIIAPDGFEALKGNCTVVSSDAPHVILDQVEGVTFPLIEGELNIMINEPDKVGFTYPGCNIMFCKVPEVAE